MKDPDTISRAIYHQMADLFEVSAIYDQKDRLLFRARPYFDKNEAVSKMRRRLHRAGFEAAVREDHDGFLISVREIPRPKIPRLNILLFLATLLTMFLAPLFSGAGWDYLRDQTAMNEQLKYAVALMAILLFHEFGHYLAGRRRGILMSLPYFIPAPTPIGTFGAVIKSRSPFTNRRDLIEVGAAGPISGFVIAIIVLAIGLNNAEIVIPEAGGNLILGDSLLIRFLSWLLLEPIPEGYSIASSNLIFAGWVGLLVTMINLLPLGQLDGGHIIYGLLGRWQHKISRLFLMAMLLLGFLWPGWWFFGGLVFILGINHPPTYDDTTPLSKTAKILGWAAIIIFIICFIPAPFAVV